MLFFDITGFRGQFLGRVRDFALLRLHQRVRIGAVLSIIKVMHEGKGN